MERFQDGKQIGVVILGNNLDLVDEKQITRATVAGSPTLSPPFLGSPLQMHNGNKTNNNNNNTPNKK